MTLRGELMLEQFAQLLNEQGDYCDYGCSEGMVEQTIALARELFPEKPCCVVARWCWADVEIDPRQAQEIEDAGLKPCFLYANKVVFDERKRWAEGSFVRTTLLEAFHHQCIFSSQNTNYILCGPGVRLTVIPAVYNDFLPD